MSVLALKALDYGADKIPDKLFHSIPGGFFKPRDKIKASIKSSNNRRRKSEPRGGGDRSRRRAQREPSPSTDYFDSSGYDDTDHEREAMCRDRRRRAKSMGRSLSRSMSRGRHHQRSREQDGEYDVRDQMDQADRAERGSPFPLPPGSDFRPYNSQDYAPPPAGAGFFAANGYHDPYHRAASAQPDHGYPPQPPPSTARYTPGAGYSPSPANASGPNPTQVYAPYNPADYASPGQGYSASGNVHSSQPPFYRQQSHSQPSLPQYPPYPDAQAQVAVYEPPPDRYGSSSSSHHRRQGNGKHHRARSAGHHGHSRSSVTDTVRDRFESLDVHDEGLAASVGGALAGGFAANRIGHGALSTLIGAGIGAFGGIELEKKYEKKKATYEGSKAERGNGKTEHLRSPSRERRRNERHDDYTSYSDSERDDRRQPSGRRHCGSKREYDH